MFVCKVLLATEPFFTLMYSSFKPIILFQLDREFKFTSLSSDSTRGWFSGLIPGRTSRIGYLRSIIITSNNYFFDTNYLKGFLKPSKN